MSLTLADVKVAATVLGERIHETPVQSFRTAGRCRGGDLILKCENLQKTGAFKARGALHYLSRLTADQRARGVTTYSSGNHGAAVAWAAQQLEVAATVFVPEDVPASKAAAIEGYGGTVVRAGRTSADRRQAAEEAAARQEWHIVPPFDHPWIIAGQGTAGLELMRQVSGLRRVLIPVGGGGLLAGVATVVKALAPTAEVIGVEPTAAASMQAALRAGAPQTITVGPTVADGLRPVRVGELNCEIATRCVDRMVTVADEEILTAQRLLLERAHLVVEPSGAAAVAAFLFRDELAVDGVSVAVLSGGNVDLARLRQLFPAA